MKTINKLSEDLCRQAEASARPQKMFDGGGLHLFVSTKGAKRWRVAYRLDGKPQTLALGSFPAVSIDQARAAVDEARAVLKAGGDPARRINNPRAAFDRSHEIPLSLVLDKLTYDPETGQFRRREGGYFEATGDGVAGQIGLNGYRKIRLYEHTYSAHRLAWFMTYGAWPTLWIDHINGQRDDNRIANLRDVSATVNAQNRQVSLSKSAAGYVGVSRLGKGFAAKIRFEGRLVVAGGFDDPEKAHQMYLTLKRRLHDGCTV